MMEEINNTTFEQQFALEEMYSKILVPENASLGDVLLSNQINAIIVVSITALGGFISNRYYRSLYIGRADVPMTPPVWYFEQLDIPTT